MGILDPKERIMDVVITSEGRRQLRTGKFKIDYVAFTDDGTFYEQDVASGSSDATQRIYFEAGSDQHDVVMLEANDAGMLESFKNVSGVTFHNGLAVSSSYDVVGLLGSELRSLSTFMSGAAFASQVDTLLVNAADNYKSLRLLGTLDNVFGEDEFACGPSSVTFNVTERGPIPPDGAHEADLEVLEGLSVDPRLSNQLNFMYLPPINKRVGDVPKSLGDYRPWGLKRPITLHDVEREVSEYNKLGFVKKIKIDPTSRKNNLVCQVFEVGDSSARKLDVIDFGPYATKRVFFVGKVLSDADGLNTFVHMFTLLFE